MSVTSLKELVSGSHLIRLLVDWRSVEPQCAGSLRAPVRSFQELTNLFYTFLFSFQINFNSALPMKGIKLRRYKYKAMVKLQISVNGGTPYPEVGYIM